MMTVGGSRRSATIPGTTSHNERLDVYARALVLIAGLPGTGKSRLSQLVCEALGPLTEISIDPIKESTWDREGFDSLEEKRMLDGVALSQFFSLIERSMQRSERIIADYPLSEKQRPELECLCAAHSYRPVTVRMTADLDVLYERQRRRDLDDSRHLGHISHRYHVGDTCLDRSQAPGLLTREEFVRRCTTRGYDTFALGPVKEVDTSDFSAVDYPAVIAWIADQYRAGEVHDESP